LTSLPTAGALDVPRAPLPRLESIDAVRGVIMILMALDHVRDFFGQPGANPLDVAHAGAGLFLTRWVTHVCAPGFFLLTGVGARLGLRQTSKAQLSRFLAERGVWLLVLDVFVVRCFGLQFNVDYRVTMLIVLWALGWAMIVLAGLIHLPDGAILAFAVVTITAHNAFDGVAPAAFGALAPLWSILHVPGVLLATPRVTVLVGYPLIPWIAVTAAGWVLGRAYGWPEGRRRALLARLGAGCCAGFVALRALNLYGDPLRWSRQASATRTAMSFLSTVKYPPSLLFLLMTLGPILLLLAALERRPPAPSTDGPAAGAGPAAQAGPTAHAGSAAHAGRAARPLQAALVFGRVPLFYYLVHMPLIHLAAVAVCLARYGDAHWMFQSPSLDRFPFTSPPGWGFDLPIVYLIWIAVVLSLYPLCRWYAGVKRRGDARWLSYL
jgi:uncharacterized membrane protein